MNDQNLNTKLIIEACREQTPAAQKKLFELFYAYAMSIALRYTHRKEDAEEILSEAFCKMYKKIDQYDSNFDFKYWFRRIIINTAIDFNRKYKNKTVGWSAVGKGQKTVNNAGLEQLQYSDLLNMIQSLSPRYRTVFNMYVIDGYKHYEIADRLGISLSSSKTNYMKARQRLQRMIHEQFQAKAK